MANAEDAEEAERQRERLPASPVERLPASPARLADTDADTDADANFFSKKKFKIKIKNKNFKIKNSIYNYYFLLKF